MDKYFLAIQENVCSVCVDSSETGKCLLSENEICAVEKLLPQIIKVVQSFESDNIEDYINSLRTNVCSHCRTQNDLGYCYLREDSNCSLDRYFPVIVETIKRVDKKNK